uniref:Uncharacterized protein n=1 Tax=Romanomermis culicivorax TaxID=13658 RepID=A0A915KAE2_ROMCU
MGRAFVEQTITSNMLMISILIFTSFLQIDASIVTEINYCAPSFPCDASSLKCDDADPQSLDIYFLFDRALNDEAILGVEMLKRNFASHSRFGLYVKMIQYNIEGSSQEDCPLVSMCKRIPEQRIANITKIIKTSAFAKCPNVENEWKVTLSVFQKTEWNNTIKLVCKLHPYSSGNVEYELINEDEEIIGRNDNGTFFLKLTDRHADFWCRASFNNRRISSRTAFADSQQGIPLARK